MILPGSRFLEILVSDTIVEITMPVWKSVVDVLIKEKIFEESHVDTLLLGAVSLLRLAVLLLILLILVIVDVVVE